MKDAAEAEGEAVEDAESLPTLDGLHRQQVRDTWLFDVRLVLIRRQIVVWRIVHLGGGSDSPICTSAAMLGLPKLGGRWLS